MSSWSSVTLEGVTAGGTEGLRRGPFGGAIKKDSFTSDGYKIYEQKHAIYGDFEAGSYFIGEHHYRKLKTFAVQTGDMLVSCSGTLGRVAIVPAAAKPGIINQALLRIRPKPELVFPVFLKMLLETPELQSSLFGSAGGSAIKNIRPLSAIRQVEFSIPPLPEQRRIAAILDQADSLRAKRRTALAELDTLTQSVFLDLFGDTAFNVRKWPRVPLIGVCGSSDNIKCGPFGTQLSRSEFRTDGVPLWGIKNVNKLFNLPTHEFLEPRTAKRLMQYSLEPGDIVMTRKGTVGNCAVYPDTLPLGIMHSDLLRLRVNLQTCEPVFLAHQLHYSRDVEGQLALISGGAVMPGINVTRLKTLEVLIPPVELQREFARHVSAVEKLKTAHRAHLAELDALFASLQHRAFRGEL